MPPQPAIHVLIAAADAIKRSQWAQWLADMATVHGLNADPPPANPALDVIVTDADDPADWLQRHGFAAAADRDVGRVGVGIEIESCCDAALPAEPTRRELRLACRLVAQITRLRRHNRTADQAQQQLFALAHRDPLTELPNRRAWDEQLRLRIEALQNVAPASIRGKQPPTFCLMILDLDHFKEVNKFHGYAAGDRLLKAVGKALTKNLRQGDFVARLGGDEFGLLLDAVHPASARPVVERLRKCVSATRGTSREPEKSLESRVESLEPESESYGVTASAGFVVCTTGAADLEGCFQRADDALRVAKQAGRNRSETGTESP